MCFYFLVCISINLQDDQNSGKEGKTTTKFDVDPHVAGGVEKTEGAKVCDNHCFDQFEYGVIIVFIPFQIVEKLFRRKVVIQDDVTDEALSDLDLEAIGKSIIVVPDSESTEANIEVDMASIDETIASICKDVEIFKFMNYWPNQSTY